MPCALAPLKGVQVPAADPAHSFLSQVEERPEPYILRAGANEGKSTQMIQRASDS